LTTSGAAVRVWSPVLSCQFTAAGVGANRKPLIGG
jgi:hypothetical protein